MNADKYARNPIAFCDDMIKVNERGQAFRLLDHQRAILRTAFTFDREGRLPWDTFVYSCPKKGGKTTINAALTTWWAFTQEPPNEVFVLANDQEQAMSRTFSSAARLITRNAALAEAADVQTKRIMLSNGTTITALASEFRGAAGSNHGLVSLDEVWAFTSEASRRLVDELTSVPTRRNSVRFITTYAGWEGESDLLHELYVRGVGADEHPEGQGERLHPTLPIWINREARLLVYWDHEARMPWQTPTYYEGQRRSLREGVFARLHLNRWTTGEGSFITAEDWDACVESSWELADADRHLQAWGGLDASTKSDATALVVVTFDPTTKQVVLLRHKIWTPTLGRPIDLEAAEAAVLEIHEQFRLRRLYADPYQLYRSITSLQRQGVRIKEYPQTVPNLVRMAKALDDVIKSRQLVVYPDETMKAHALAAAAEECGGEGQFRIVKRGGRRIDSLIALAMAAVATVDEPYREPIRGGVLA